MQLRVWYLYMKSFATLTCPKLFLLYSLTDFFGIRKLALFCCHDMRYQILSYTPIYVYFCVVLHSARANISDCTHLHQFLTICTHPSTLMPAPHGYDCLGKFPGHKAEKHVLCINIYAWLPCFPVRLHSCILSHPSASIRAQSHLLAPTQTLNSTAYMYYLC